MITDFLGGGNRDLKKFSNKTDVREDRHCCLYLPESVTNYLCFALESQGEVVKHYIMRCAKARCPVQFRLQLSTARLAVLRGVIDFNLSSGLRNDGTWRLKWKGINELILKKGNYH
ncbi:hypothetical protein AVEN_236196-1 [Araneus ventricosus]|uniref:Uncharacterized protein n=1 Tax=Araneus ventricosus TaxID=182803 RepID=A0A4Y2NJF2_ARAVE|nr:hypothetical protein AVEN_236196-1 [Araneus ventricosus]